MSTRDPISADELRALGRLARAVRPEALGLALMASADLATATGCGIELALDSVAITAERAESLMAELKEVAC